jgi:hypothetical protein
MAKRYILPNNSTVCNAFYNKWLPMTDKGKDILIKRKPEDS